MTTPDQLREMSDDELLSYWTMYFADSLPPDSMARIEAMLGMDFTEPEQDIRMCQSEWRLYRIDPNTGDRLYELPGDAGYALVRSNQSYGFEVFPSLPPEQSDNP